jgi:hypothetical protein
MSTMNDIETLAKQLADARAELADRLQRIKDEQESVKRRYLQGAKNSVERVRAAHLALSEAVEAAPQLFVKPKTRVFHGLRVGWMKQRGKLLWDKAENVIAALRKLLGAEAEQYIDTKETPSKERLENLPAAQLRRIGVTVTDDTDAVVVKATGGDIEKLIDALIGNEEVEELVS